MKHGLRVVVTTTDEEGLKRDYIVPLADKGSVSFMVDCARPLGLTLHRDFCLAPHHPDAKWMEMALMSGHRVCIDMEVNSGLVAGHERPGNGDMDDSLSNVAFKYSRTEIDEFMRSFNHTSGMFSIRDADDINMRNQNSDSIVGE